MEKLPDFPQGADALIREAEPRIPSVGRIEFVNYQMAWGGTGWIVEEAPGGRRLVITNRHVAALVAKPKADGSAIFMRNPAGQRYSAKVNFRAEAGEQGASRTVELTEIEYLADDTSADIALLSVGAGGGSLPNPLGLDDRPVRKKDLVAIIGYPAFDSRNNVDDQARYFRDLYEVKRFAPGFVLQDSEGGASLSHDSTTLGGNSGSPLLRLDGGGVIGLHFSGIYGKGNSAVKASTIEVARTSKGGQGLAAMKRVNDGQRVCCSRSSWRSPHDARVFPARRAAKPPARRPGTPRSRAAQAIAPRSNLQCLRPLIRGRSVSN